MTQMALTVLSPVTAGYVCMGIKSVVAMLMPAAEVPSFLAPVVGHLPSTMDETIVCSLMMLSVNPALEMIDHFANQHGAAMVKKHA